MNDDEDVVVLLLSIAGTVCAVVFLGFALLHLLLLSTVEVVTRCFEGQAMV
jgi:hypothetical protein